VTRRELAARLAKKTGLSARTAAQVLATLVDLVVEELARASRLEWRRLGTFAMRRYPARKIHVPATGQTRELPERAGVTFKPSRLLLSRLQTRRPQRALPGAIGRSRRVRPTPASPPPPMTRRRLVRP
jgi:nucleoid DNA-binding protein